MFASIYLSVEKTAFQLEEINNMYLNSAYPNWNKTLSRWQKAVLLS
jgi:hypothetical protein